MGNEKTVKILITFFSFPIKKILNGLLTSTLRALISISHCKKEHENQKIAMFLVYKARLVTMFK